MVLLSQPCLLEGRTEHLPGARCERARENTITPYKTSRFSIQSLMLICILLQQDETSLLRASQIHLTGDVASSIASKLEQNNRLLGRVLGWCLLIKQSNHIG